jgi:hypothetical protein
VAGEEGRSELPPCGLYRAGIALSGHETQVPAGLLIYFHNHSEQGPPLVLLPQSNSNNRWTFTDKGYLVEDPAFVAALVARRPQGFYVVGRHIHIGREEIIPERTLVQLGYNRDADPIVFVGRFEGNSIVFPERGYRFTDDRLFEHLEPAGFAVPGPNRVLH